MKDSFKRPDRANRIFILIMLVSVVMRFWGLGDKSLSNDELSALSRLDVNSFGDLIRIGVCPDFHPAGIQVLLYYWTAIFGISPIAVRFPFALMGILLLLPAYSLGKKWFGPVTALILCVLLGFSEFTLLYSQTARPYISGLFFILCFTWFWSEFLSGKKRNFRTRAGFVITLTLCMYNHYFSFLTAALIAGSGLFIISRRDLLSYLLCGFLSILLFIPHLGISIEHFSRGGLSTWLGPPEWTSLFDFVKYSFNDSWLLAIGLAGLTLPVLKLRQKEKGKREFSLSWFLIIWAIAHFYSIWVNPVFQFSVLIFVVPFLWLFLFSFVGQELNRLSGSLIMLAGLCVLTSTIYLNGYYGKSHFGEFKKLGHQIEKWNGMLGAGRITHTVNVNGPFYIHYYLGEKTRIASYELGTDPVSLARFRELVENAGTPYFSHGWSTRPKPDEAKSIIREQYPVLISEFDYPNSGISLFGRGVREKPNNFIIEEDFENMDQKAVTDSISFSGEHSFKLSEAFPYSASIRFSRDSLADSLQYVLAEAWFLNPEQAELTLVMTLGKEEKNIIWRGMDAEPFTAGKNGWVRVFLVQRLPEKEVAESITVYAWHRNGAPALVDRMRIHFLQKP